MMYKIIQCALDLELDMKSLIMKLYNKYDNNHEHLMNIILLQFSGEW